MKIVDKMRKVVYNKDKIKERKGEQNEIRIKR